MGRQEECILEQQLDRDAVCRRFYSNGTAKEAFEGFGDFKIEGNLRRTVNYAEYLALLSGIESRWGRDFPPVQIGPGVHPASCKMGTGSFPGVKCGRGLLLTTYPLLVPRSRKSRAIPLPTLWAT